MTEILHPPKAVVLKASGINCDRETQYAFEKAGAASDIVHLNQLNSREIKIGDYQIVVIPGGFSYGDDLASGRVMAIELQRRLADDLLEHSKEKKRPIIGICNGFQVLVQTGLLPFGEIASLDKVQASLAPNNSGRFESRWIHLLPEKNSASLFALDEDKPLYLPVAHGEGRFVTSQENIAHIENEGLVVFRYCDIQGVPTQIYPDNPNGSMHSIAGICDPQGNILGLMPHPERYVDRFKHPNWRRNPKDTKPDGLKIIESIVNYARQL